MNFQTYHAKLAWSKQLNERFREYHFELLSPSKLSFEAGQYIMINIPDVAYKRSYSIASPPSMNHAIELLLDLLPQGPGTKYLQQLEDGDTLEFIAPLGNFTVASPQTPIGQSEKELLFIATGSGVTPFKSMLNDLLIDKQDQRPMTLLWGMRQELDQFWYDDFGILAEEHSNFSFQPVLSRPSPKWPFHKGYVTDVLSIQAEYKEIGYYLCGSNNMITDVKMLLQEKGVDAQNVHTESFF